MAFMFIIIWLACAFLTAFIAKEKGREVGLWVLLGLVFGFFAMIAVAVLPENKEA